MAELMLKENKLNPVIRWVLLFVVFFGVTAFYLNYLTNNFEYDSISYAISMENNVMIDIFHPHHLLYNYFKWEIFNLLKAHGFTGRALLVCQVFNVIMGALGACFLFLTVRFITKDIFVSFLSSVFLVFCYGYWYCSTFGSVRIMGTALLILTLFIALYFAMSKQDRFWKSIAIVFLIALSHGFAVFSHQTNMMFAVVVITAMFFRKDVIFKKVIYIAVYILAFLIIVIGVYYYVGVKVYYLKDSDDFYRWLTSYAGMGVWGKLTSKSLELAKHGLTGAFIGSIDRNALMYNTTARNRDIINLFYYSLCALGIYSILFFIRIFKKWKIVIISCLAWLSVYTPFFIWWEPENIEFWISSLPPLIILASLPFADLWSRWKFIQIKVIWKVLVGLIIVVLISIFSWYNFYGAILPQCDPANNKYFNTLKNLGAISSGNDLLIVAGLDALDKNILYFAPRDFVSVYGAYKKFKGREEDVFSFIEKRTDEKLNNNKRVFLHKEVISFKDFDFIKARFPGISKENLLSFIDRKFILAPAGSDRNFWFYEVKRKDGK